MRRRLVSRWQRPQLVRKRLIISLLAHMSESHGFTPILLPTDVYWRACDAARHDGMFHLVQMQRLLLRKRQANQFRKGSTGQAGSCFAQNSSAFGPEHRSKALEKMLRVGGNSIDS